MVAAAVTWPRQPGGSSVAAAAWWRQAKLPPAVVTARQSDGVGAAAQLGGGAAAEAASRRRQLGGGSYLTLCPHTFPKPARLNLDMAQQAASLGSLKRKGYSGKSHLLYWVA
jgi:hypothetical protein